MEKLTMMTENSANENFRKLAELFPNAVTERMNENGIVERAIDKDILMQEISCHVVEGREQRYEFTWPDKRKAILRANSPTTNTLRPCIEESVDFDTTGNLYIEGDNLEVLKVLKETYHKKVKMIYIDPPYNTGKDFVYKDNFAMNMDEFKRMDAQVDEEGNRLVQNTESNGRYHTDWLNMMYSRLKVARELLTDDGAIFISIDDNEQANLKKICDEVFGEINYVDSVVWDKKSSAKGVPPKNMLVNVHEYIVIYQKSDQFKFLGEKRNEIDDGFKNPDNDPRGPWRESNIKSTIKPIEDAFTIKDPITGKEYTNTWAFSRARLEQMISEGRILWKENLPKQKEYLFEMTNENKAIKSSWGVYDAQSTTMFLKNLLPEVKFDNPKPINLMLYLLRVSLDTKAIVIDFFSGSATTAHAVMQLNTEDNGNRKFIMVQMPEKCEEKSETYKAGYKNICEIGKERIRRAGKKIKEENPLLANDLDTGFRVLKLDSSNMKEVYYGVDDIKQDLIDSLADNIKEDRNDLDLLFQVMLNLGIMLDSKINVRNSGTYSYYIVGDIVEGVQPDLIACFDKNLNDSIITELAKQKPLYAVFRDNSFAQDDTLTNMDEIFKYYSPDTTRRVL